MSRLIQNNFYKMIVLYRRNICIGLLHQLIIYFQIKKITLLIIEYILRNIESFSVELISNKKYQYPRMGFLIKNVIPGLVLKLCTLIHNLYIFVFIW